MHDVAVTRLYDVTTGYISQSNPCDFIIYKYPSILYLECKSVHGNTLNFKSDIRENQWESLLQYSKVKGVNAGIICWFIDNDITIYLDINDLQYLKEQGNKSFNIKKDIPSTIVYGKKRRVFFDYDLRSFLKEISYD